MNEDIIEKLLDALIEDYSLEELLNDVFILRELDMLLGMVPPEAIYFLKAAIELKKIRSSKIPEWKRYLMIH